MNNSESKKDVTFEFCAKILSWDQGRNITERQVWIALQAYKMTGAPFKECVEAAYDAEVWVKKEIYNK